VKQTPEPARVPGLLRRTRADFARRWRLVFAWQALVQLIGFATVAPLGGWLVHDAVARSGSAVVSRHDVASFLLTPHGVAFVLLGLLGAVAFHTAQFAGYTWIAGHAVLRRPLTLQATLGAVWLRRRLLVDVALRMYGRMLLLAVPFLAILALVAWTTLRGHDLDSLLALRPPEWRRAVLAAGVIGAGYAYVVLAQFARWIYSMPIAMFHAPAAPAVLEGSERMLEGRLLRSIAPLVVWWLGLTLATIACYRLGRTGAEAAMAWVGPTDLASLLPLVLGFFGVTLLYGIVYATLQFAGHQFLITRAYAERREGGLWLGAAAEGPAARLGERVQRPVVLGLLAVTGLAFVVGGTLVSRADVRNDAQVTASLPATGEFDRAVREAVVAGAGWVHVDVTGDRDGTPVVRAGGSSLALDAFLAALGGRARALLDLGRVTGDADLLAGIVGVLQDADYVGTATVASHDLGTVERLRRLAPEVRTGLLVSAAPRNELYADVDVLLLNSAHASAAAVRRAHATGKEVHAWTVREPEAMLRMVERGVDNVVTTDPARLVRLLRERERLSSGQRIALALRALYVRDPVELRDPRSVAEP
jgi:glycerophosphoryl diester phosphodiesterase